MYVCMLFFNEVAGVCIYKETTPKGIETVPWVDKKLEMYFKARHFFSLDDSRNSKLQLELLLSCDRIYSDM